MDDGELTSGTSESVAPAVAVKITESSPKGMLAQWANEQDGWVREAVAQALVSNRPLSESQLDALVERFLIEKGFSEQPDGYSVTVPPIELGDDEASTEDLLELDQLSDVAGVNALAAGQVLKFDDSLTVLFGQNGAGKTGYSRVLKRLAAVRTAEEILPNAHDVGATTHPTATITYSLNGEPSTVAWNNEAGVSPLTRMSVFDAPAVMLHVDGDLNYVFTPREIALFTYVSTALKHVQDQVETEAASLRPSGNPFLAHFQRGTSVYPKIETIGATTDISELAKLADGSEEADALHEKLSGEVAALKAGSVEARHDAVGRELERVKALAQGVRKLLDFDATAYEESRLALERLEDEYRQARTELFEEGELPGPPDDEWSAFISEGDRYRKHLGFEGHPTTSDSCLYCRQSLSEKAVALLAKYRTYLDDVLAKQVDEARLALAKSRIALGSLSVDVLKEHARQVASTDPLPAYATGLDEVVDGLKLFDEACKKGAELDSPQDAKTAALALSPLLASAIENLTSALADLTTQKEGRVAVLKEKESQLAELSARRSLARHLPAMRTTVGNAKRAARMDTLTKSMSTTTQRSLTVLSKQASEDLVNKNFETLFADECQALNAPNVGLEFQGRRGQAERKKVVAKYKPSAVLSEGELKVLAIADFLAECRMTGVKAPIIFDDPVTSLDYLRLNEVAERISQLADTHQVVVFTHNIFFASTLIGLRDSRKLAYAFYEVRANETEKGFLQAGGSPRQDSPAQVAKRINKTVELAKAAGKDDLSLQEAMVEQAYGQLRAWCEAFVEQELLANVTQRHRANLMMGGLEKIKLDRFETAKSALIPLFDRCSRFMPGHSQSIEQLNVKPGLAEFEKDWAAAQLVRKEYIA